MTERLPNARKSHWATELLLLPDDEPSTFVQTGLVYACFLYPSLSCAPC